MDLGRFFRPASWGGWHHVEVRPLLTPRKGWGASGVALPFVPHPPAAPPLNSLQTPRMRGAQPGPATLSFCFEKGNDAPEWVPKLFPPFSRLAFYHLRTPSRKIQGGLCALTRRQ